MYKCIEDRMLVKTSKHHSVTSSYNHLSLTCTKTVNTHIATLLLMMHDDCVSS